MEATKSITVLAALENYLNKVQENSDNNYQTEYPTLWANGQAPKYHYQRTPKWYKVFREDSQKCVFCFIDPANGDIYKAAGWNAPAKGVRGNIFNDKLPLTSGSLYR
jgi:hypothetical protein